MKIFDRVTIVSYGDEKYSKSISVLKNEVNSCGIKNFVSHNPSTLPRDFIKKHFDFFSKNQRGGGYWLWKPCIVKESLKLIKEGDYLFYADAGCTFNKNGLNRFLEWIEFCENYNNLSFQMTHLPEKNWSKMNLVNYMNCNEEKYLETGQLMATTFGLKKTKFNVDLIEEWLRICSLEWTIDDCQSDYPNDPSFNEHRHDQSVFSLLRKRENFYTILDETYPTKTHNWNDPFVKNVPILATRRRII